MWGNRDDDLMWLGLNDYIRMVITTQAQDKHNNNLRSTMATPTVNLCQTEQGRMEVYQPQMASRAECVIIRNLTLIAPDIAVIKSQNKQVLEQQCEEAMKLGSLARDNATILSQNQQILQQQHEMLEAIKNKTGTRSRQCGHRVAGQHILE